MKKKLGLLVVLLSLFLVGSYVYQQQAGYAGAFRVSLSTPRGNDILVEEVVFDDTWRTLGARIDCCWGGIGGVRGITDHPIPQTVFVRWRQIDEEIVYEGTVELPGDLAQQVRKLPEYTRVSDGRKGRGTYFVIGMEADGQITVWLSNARSENNRQGRVFKVVATGQAKGRHEPTPEDLVR
ncbi:hypothetical protein CAI21_10145 [Alkalilimnicola ehrlichii]|nr:DUF2931 family protein [Alkalilimnicola ehrlichii]RFA29411.1 hypothetical protein CAI21_10145 [Alkalilimnicola ehrlichii]